MRDTCSSCKIPEQILLPCSLLRRVSTAALDFSRARSCSCVFANRLQKQFVALVDVCKIFEVNLRSESIAAVAVGGGGRSGWSGSGGRTSEPDPEAIRDDPGHVELACVLAIFYLPAPVPDGPGAADGVPEVTGSADRMFVLMHPFADQAQGYADRMPWFGLRFHAVRVPVAATIRRQRPPAGTVPCVSSLRRSPEHARVHCAVAGVPR